MYNEIIDKIKQYDTIMIARHIGVDPDALCSQLALRDSIRLTFPEKKVLAIGTGSQKFAHFGKLDKLEASDNTLFLFSAPEANISHNDSYKPPHTSLACS